MPILNQASARRVPPSGVRKLAATRMRPASSSKRKECGGGLSTAGACVLAAATKATRQSSITSGGSSRRNKGISAFLPRKAGLARFLAALRFFYSECCAGRQVVFGPDEIYALSLVSARVLGGE